MHRAFPRRSMWFFALPLAMLGFQAQAFDYEALTTLAQTRAVTPVSATKTNPLPAALAALDYDGVRDIRWRPERALWRSDKQAFEAMFFHLGLYQTEPVLINEILPDGKVEHFSYRSTDFDYGKNTLQPERWGDLGFAGFRLHYPLNSTQYKDELIVFQGASYFRALGSGQQYGLSARGLAIDTVGTGTREEFPRFTEFWLQRPALNDSQVTVYALMESPRVTGAYQFVIKPGSSTVTEVRARVFVRSGVEAPAISTLGIAPLTSMFVSGENQPLRRDFRPEVHDSDGLMVASGEGEWLWRPLQRPQQISVSSFSTTNPRGFGLMQRDRSWSSYEDIEARYERRPSAWIRPRGDWGAGRVELVQLPTPDETHDNIVAYWVPAQAAVAGSRYEFSYDILWQGSEQQRPPNAWVSQSRRGIGYTKLDDATLANQAHFVIDFNGPALSALSADATIKAVFSSDSNGRIAETHSYQNPVTQGWRATVRVERIDPKKPVELRGFLQQNNDTVSETWTYLLLPE